jgi:hypothetical protein
VGNFLSHDMAGYKREQILSSTLFRLYLALGGGHDDVAVRRTASRRTVWLLFETIASLSPTAAPAKSEDFLRLLIEADLTTDSPVVPTAGGILHKALRWCFEQQGLFQPAGAPTPVASAGAPPEIDVFIDDSRLGGYGAFRDYQTTPPGIWCRVTAGAGPQVHEDPIVGQMTRVNVAVSNRGSETASGVTVRVAVKAGSDDAWPAGWTDLAPGVGAQTVVDVAPAQTVVFGPFEWTPGQPGDALVFADAHCEDDESIVRATLRGAVAAKLIATLDNNAALRLVTVVDPNA